MQTVKRDEFRNKIGHFTSSDIPVVITQNKMPNVIVIPHSRYQELLKAHNALKVTTVTEGVKAFGSKRALARHFGASMKAVNRWQKKGGSIPNRLIQQ